MRQSIKMNNKGFSILELIVVMAIVVTLSGLMVPQFMKYVAEKREVACVENRDAIVNTCEKLVYSGVPIDRLQNCVADIASGGSADTWAIPDEYAETIKAHWICPEDGSHLTVSVDLSNNIIKCECSAHGSQDVVADMTTWGGVGDVQEDPGFAVPSVAIPTLGITPSVTNPAGPTPTPGPHISDAYWPDIADSRWDSAGRYSSSYVEVRVPSGKFAMKSAGATTTYYVLIDRDPNNSNHKFKIFYEHCFDPTMYMFGGSGGTESVIATNGTEYTEESIMAALTSNPSLRQTDNDSSHTINDWQFVISGGTIFDNGEHRYIFFHQGQDQYAKLPTKYNVEHNGEDGGNKFGNWYLMADTDEID